MSAENKTLVDKLEEQEQMLRNAMLPSLAGGIHMATVTAKTHTCEWRNTLDDLYARDCDGADMSLPRDPLTGAPYLSDKHCGNCQGRIVIKEEGK